MEHKTLKTKNPAAIIIAAALIALGFFLAMARSTHRLRIKTYFEDAQGLRTGARVRVAGVDVGLVSDLHVRPEMHAAEVTMDLQTPYELHVPSDAIATVQTAGVLGDSFVQISIQNASGPPLKNGDVIKSQPSPGITPQQWMECFSNVAQHKPCDLSAPASGDQKGAHAR
ncbi:MAG TPA: MlaD family protein [Terriglobales bacterium]|nr:MlaD family protein [Terriglobales bacterium]